MPTFATPQDTERRREELDALIRAAWAEYSEALRELDGRAYDDTESASWQQLQTTLRRLADGRAANDAGDPPD